MTTTCSPCDGITPLLRPGSVPGNKRAARMCIGKHSPDGGRPGFVSGSTNEGIYPVTSGFVITNKNK